MARVANINDVLEGHVALEIDCVDRLLLNAYVPSLQVGGQIVRFLCGHLGNPTRSFFEALVADNIGIGRPEQVSMVFSRQLRRPTHHRYQTRIFSTGTEVRIDFRYKHSRVKQYLKDGRALRIETVINNPDDLEVKRRLHHLPELVEKARAVNQRLLMIEQAGQSCAVGICAL